MAQWPYFSFPPFLLLLLPSSLPMLAAVYHGFRRNSGGSPATHLPSLSRPLVILSPSPRLSNSLACSFSISPSLYLSLPLSRHLVGPTASRALLAARAGHLSSEEAEMPYASSAAARTPAFCWWVALEEGRRFPTVDLPSPATFNGYAGHPQVPLDTLFKMVPWFVIKVTRFQNTFFETNCQNFDSRVKSNETLFSGNNLKLLITVKNDFQWYIMCLCLESFA